MSPVGGHTGARLDGSSLCPQSSILDVIRILHIVFSGQSSLSRAALSSENKYREVKCGQRLCMKCPPGPGGGSEELSESEDRPTPFNKFAAQAELYRA